MYTVSTHTSMLYFHPTKTKTDIPMKDFLEQFGEHTFAVYWHKSTHDTLLEVLGDSMYELVGNLDSLHNHLSGTYTKMIAPSFSCEKIGLSLKVCVCVCHC